MRIVVSFIFLAAFSSQVARGNDFESLRLENWHQWRGPSADGSSPTANPPTRWDESTNVRWKVPIPGASSSTPIVWNGRIYLTTAIPTERKGKPVSRAGSAPPVGSRGESGRGGRGSRGGFGGGTMIPPENLFQFVVLCLDLKSGQLLWQKVATEQQPHEGHHPTHGFASASATTNGRLLLVSFGSRGIFCFDLDGNLKWQRDLGDMQTRNGFGEGTSPALHGDRVIINWDHEAESFIVCLDANSGEEIWRTGRDEPTTWNTPLFVEHDGVTQVVVNGTNRSRGYDLADGRLIWECGGQFTNPIPSPVTTGSLVYCMTGYQGYALYAIPLSARGDITGTDKIAWHRGESTPYVSSPLLYGGLLYFCKSRNGILTCLKADSGEEVFAEKRLEDIPEIYASIGGAGGKVYVTGRNGTTVVLKHGSDDEILSVNRLDEGIDASPVFVGNDLLLRGSEHLYCISEQ